MLYCVLELMMALQLLPGVAPAVSCNMPAVGPNETTQLTCFFGDRPHSGVKVEFQPKGSNVAGKILYCELANGDMQCKRAELPFGKSNYVKNGQSNLTLEARGSREIEGQYTCMPIPSDSDSDFLHCTFDLDTTTTTTGAPQSVVDTTTTTMTIGAPSGNTDTSLIVCAVFGTVVVLGVLVFLVACVCFRRFRKRVTDCFPCLKRCLKIEQSMKVLAESTRLVTTVSPETSERQETNRGNDMTLPSDVVIDVPEEDTQQSARSETGAAESATTALLGRASQNGTGGEIHDTDPSNSGMKQQGFHYPRQEQENMPVYATQNETAGDAQPSDVADRSEMEADRATERKTPALPKRALQNNSAVEIHRVDPSRRVSNSGLEQSQQGFHQPSQERGARPIFLTQHGLASSQRSIPAEKEADCHGIFSKMTSQLTDPLWIRAFIDEVNSKKPWYDIAQVQTDLLQAQEIEPVLTQLIKASRAGIYPGTVEIQTLEDLHKEIKRLIYFLCEKEKILQEDKAFQLVMSQSERPNFNSGRDNPPQHLSPAGECESPTVDLKILKYRDNAASPVQVESNHSSIGMTGEGMTTPTSPLGAKGSSPECPGLLHMVHQSEGLEASANDGHVGDSPFSPAHNVHCGETPPLSRGSWVPMTGRGRGGGRPPLKLETDPTNNRGITPVKIPSRETSPSDLVSSAPAHSIYPPKCPQGQPGRSSTAARSSICVESALDGASQHQNTAHAGGMEAWDPNLIDKDVGKQPTGADFSPTDSKQQLPGFAYGFEASNRNEDNHETRGSARLEASNGSGDIHEKMGLARNYGLPQMAIHTAEEAGGKHIEGSVSGTSEATLLESGRLTARQDKPNTQLPVEYTGHSTLDKEEGGFTKEHKPAVCSGKHLEPAETTSGNMLTTDSKSTEHLSKEELTDVKTASKSQKKSLGENEEGQDQNIMRAASSHENSYSKVEEGFSCQDDAYQGTRTVVTRKKNNVRDMKFLKVAEEAFGYVHKNFPEQELETKMLNEFEENFKTCYSSEQFSSICPESRQTLADVLNTSVYEKTAERLLVAILCNACKCTVQIFYPQGDQEQYKIKMHGPCREGVQSETTIHLRVHYTGEYCHFSPISFEERS